LTRRIRKKMKRFRRNRVSESRLRRRIAQVEKKKTSQVSK